MNKIKNFHIAMWCMFAIEAILSILIGLSIPLHWSMMSATIMMTIEMVVLMVFLIVLQAYHEYDKKLIKEQMQQKDV